MSDHDNEISDHYRPPMPEPVRVNDPIKALALGGVIGAPLLFVFVGMILAYEPPLIGAVCAVVFVASFVTLFVRADRNRAPIDDGWDNGAVL